MIQRYSQGKVLAALEMSLAILKGSGILPCITKLFSMWRVLAGLIPQHRMYTVIPVFNEISSRLPNFRYASIRLSASIL